MLNITAGLEQKQDKSMRNQKVSRRTNQKNRLPATRQTALLTTKYTKYTKFFKSGHKDGG
jgi:hypothetical protein